MWNILTQWRQLFRSAVRAVSDASRLRRRRWTSQRPRPYAPLEFALAFFVTNVQQPAPLFIADVFALLSGAPVLRPRVVSFIAARADRRHFSTSPLALSDTAPNTASVCRGRAFSK
jgi:hypothetical protein